MTLLLCRNPAAVDCSFDIDLTIDQFDEFICNGQLHGGRLHHYVAVHFLVWLRLSDIQLQSVDGAVIERFLHHRCRCRDFDSPLNRLRCRKSHFNRLELIRFIRFLEQAGYVDTPGDLQANVSLADGFIERLLAQGYGHKTIDLYRGAALNLIIWLHFFRIALCELTPSVLECYQARRFRCVIPGLFEAQSDRFSKTHHYAQERFVDYLIDIGRIDAACSNSAKPPLPAILEAFTHWLEHDRGVGPTTVDIYLSELKGALQFMGEDPSQYDSAMIDKVSRQQIQGRSNNYANRFLKALRMYLRFVISRYCLAASLIDAVPTVMRRQLAQLPQHISNDDVERTINSCLETDAGVRDRAILLLLARLALRASDITALRLDDINWEQAQIRVCGKSHRQDILPLPQDVGDALYRYIATVRPKVDSEHVFLLVKAPYRPFSHSSQIGRIVHFALDRAGVAVARGNRGAHLLRRSRATNLLRDGATLDSIQALLRHHSADTTMIYAKTDTVMLQEIAQPWVPGGQS